jgi:hypothetical protein
VERSKTYYGFLDTIAGNGQAIEQEKNRLDAKIADLGERIRERLTPTTVPGLLWCLALKECERLGRDKGIHWLPSP